MKALVDSVLMSSSNDVIKVSRENWGYQVTKTLIKFSGIAIGSGSLAQSQMFNHFFHLRFRNVTLGTSS